MRRSRNQSARAKEMLEKALIQAKQLLRFDREFIEKVKTEIREEFESELKDDFHLIVVA